MIVHTHTCPYMRNRFGACGRTGPATPGGSSPIRQGARPSQARALVRLHPRRLCGRRMMVQCRRRGGAPPTARMAGCFVCEKPGAIATMHRGRREACRLVSRSMLANDACARKATDKDFARIQCSRAPESSRQSPSAHSHSAWPSKHPGRITQALRQHAAPRARLSSDTSQSA